VRRVSRHTRSPIFAGSWRKWRGPGGKAALARRTPRRPPGRVPEARSAVECGAPAPLWSSIPDQLEELLRAGDAGGVRTRRAGDVGELARQGGGGLKGKCRCRVIPTQDHTGAVALNVQGNG